MLPPTSALLDPVRCVPSWFAAYRAISNKTLTSGYTVDAFGNVPGDPAAMAQAAGRKLAADTTLPADIRARGARLTLAEYTLARNISSEVGTTSIGDAVAVGQCALNRAALGGKSVNDVLLYRQNAVGPYAVNRGFYGPINGKSAQGLTAPYGRWASTTKDPTVRAIAIAQDILAGVIPAAFAKGGDDQANLTIYKSPAAKVREHADAHAYWVGPLPGVDHRRTMVFRTISVDASTAAALTARGLAALAAPSVDWSRYPVCTDDGGVLVDRNGTAVSASAAGAIAPRAAPIIAAAAATTVAVVGAALWQRQRVTAAAT